MTDDNVEPGPRRPASLPTEKKTRPSPRAKARVKSDLIAMNPELWSLDRPKLDPKNARKHSDDQLRRILASLLEFGWVFPILVDERDSVIAGNGRLEAARLGGMSDVPVLVARGWSEARRRAYAIADNRLTDTSTWDRAVLADALAELSADPLFDATVTGFSTDEIDKILDLGDDAAEVREIHTSTVDDTFWISIRGPLSKQAAVLDALKAGLDGDPAVEIDIGVISLGDDV